jgi:hypothetical protein
VESVTIIAGLVEGEARVLRAHVDHEDYGNVEALLIFEDSEEANAYLQDSEEVDAEDGWVPIPTEVDQLPVLCAVSGIGYLAVPTSPGLGLAGVGPVLDVVDRLRSV